MISVRYEKRTSWAYHTKMQDVKKTFFSRCDGDNSEINYQPTIKLSQE